jgi:A/G-specific adenine glycosylase
MAELAAAVEAWFARGHRDLPWRRTRDPYAIWVSEIMLQQTRVDTVTPRWLRWVARFPTVNALAEAPLDDVLGEWAGLGYYARARNLHAAARRIVDEHAAEFPDTLEGALALPGVGRYTAGAVLSIARGRRVPILDGNVERVLARVFRVEGDPSGGAVKARLWALATEAVLAATEPSALNQGLMELGATTCTPQRPTCLVCPLSERCGARRGGDPEAFPAATKKSGPSELALVTVAILRGGKLLLARRPDEGLWGGLYELPSGELLVGETPASAAVRVARERVGLQVSLPSPLPAPDDRFVQLLTHRRVTFFAFRAEDAVGTVRRRGYEAHAWVPLDGKRPGPTLGVSRATSRLLASLGVPGYGAG